MEHRYSERVSVRLPIEVYYQAQPPINAWVLNVGREGMYIFTDNHALPRGCLLRLSFRLPGADQREFRVPAMVVHNHGGGIGVMFQIIPNRLEQGLEKLLERAASPSKVLAFGAGD